MFLYDHMSSPRGDEEHLYVTFAPEWSSNSDKMFIEKRSWKQLVSTQSWIFSFSFFEEVDIALLEDILFCCLALERTGQSPILPQCVSCPSSWLTQSLLKRLLRNVTLGLSYRLHAIHSSFLRKFFNYASSFSAIIWKSHGIKWTVKTYLY